MVAASEGQVEVVKLLHSKGASLNNKNNNGFTALDLASENGHIKVVEYLVEEGVNFYEQVRDEVTSLTQGYSEENHLKNLF